MPGVELNCVLPGARDGHVLGLGVDGRRCGAARARRRLRRPRRDRRLDRRARRRRLPRAPLLDGRHRRDARAAVVRDGDRGLQRRLRARGRARALDRALGRARRGGTPLPGARDGRLAPPRASTPTIAWTWVRAASGRPRRCSTRCATGCFYGSTGPDDRERPPRRRRDRGRVQPVPLGDARLREDDRGGRARRHGSATAMPATITARDDDGLVTVARLDDPRRRAPRPGRGRRRARAEGVGEPVRSLSRSRALEELHETALRPARDRRRDRRRGDRRPRRPRRARRGAASTPATSAAGTSSASSKLVHGGLRYLRLGDVRLVREAHHERRVLSNVVAPHLVHRQPFLLPLYENGPFRPWFVQSGIVVYSTLARSRLNWLVQPDRARGLVPDLRRAGSARAPSTPMPGRTTLGCAWRT